MPYSKAQHISLFFTPVITGCISATASITLITTIYNSQVKLSSIYRRLVFAVSCFDVIQSLGLALSTLPIPKEENDNVWGANGNDFSCGLQGLIINVGVSGAMLYTLSLTIYFFLAIRFEMPDERIKKRIEPILHIFPLLYVSIVSIYLYASGNYSSAGQMCWIDEDSSLWNQFFGISFPTCVSFICNCTMMILIRRFVYVKERKAQRHRQTWESHVSIQNQNVYEGVGPDKRHFLFYGLCNCFRRSPEPASSSGSILAIRLSSPSLSSLQREKEVSNRALAYALGFIFTNGIPIISRFVRPSNYGEAPFTLMILPLLCFPLQGLFNVLVFTYPHVSSYRKNHTTSTWFRAFWEVVKSGGDSDHQTAGGRTSRRRTSLRQQQLVLEQCMARNRKSFRKREQDEEALSASSDKNEQCMDGDKNVSDAILLREESDDHVSNDILLEEVEKSEV